MDADRVRGSEREREREIENEYNIYTKEILLWGIKKKERKKFGAQNKNEKERG